MADTFIGYEVASPERQRKTVLAVIGVLCVLVLAGTIVLYVFPGSSNQAASWLWPRLWGSKPNADMWFATSAGVPATDPPPPGTSTAIVRIKSPRTTIPSSVVFRGQRLPLSNSSPTADEHSFAR